MQKAQINRTVFILLSIILLLVVFKCVMLYRIQFDIDSLEAQLNPLKQKISTSSHVGFYSNINPNNAYTQFLETKNIIAPKRLLDSTNFDTLLIISYKADTIKKFTGYKVLAKSENNERTINLLEKNK